MRQPPFVRPPQRRTSPPGRFEGASPKQGVTLRPEAKREKSPTSAQKARVHANPTPLSHRTASTAEARADEEAASLTPSASPSQGSEARRSASRAAW